VLRSVYHVANVQTKAQIVSNHFYHSKSNLHESLLLYTADRKRENNQQQVGTASSKARPSGNEPPGTSYVDVQQGLLVLLWIGMHGYNVTDHRGDDVIAQMPLAAARHSSGIQPHIWILGSNAQHPMDREMRLYPISNPKSRTYYLL
jgi:hypothetical protein